MLSAVARRVPAQARVINSVQKATFVSGPPRFKIPISEKIWSTALIGVGVFGYPMYVLTNVKHYRFVKDE